MSYRKLISALVFVAFGFCFSGEARAQGCDNPDFCFDFGIPSTVDNITGSSVKCELQPGGASQPFNTLDIGTGSRYERCNLHANWNGDVHTPTQRVVSRAMRLRTDDGRSYHKHVQHGQQFL